MAVNKELAKFIVTKSPRFATVDFTDAINSFLRERNYIIAKMTEPEKYWEMVLEEKFTDLIVVEKLSDGQTVFHQIHKMVFYEGCSYYRKHVDSGLKDSETDTFTLEVSYYKSIFGIIKKAMYHQSNLSNVYNEFFCELDFSTNVDKLIVVYETCDFLCLTDHMLVLEEIISTVNIKILMKWWKERQEAGLQVPAVIESSVQGYLQNSVQHLGKFDANYVSIEALLNLFNLLAKDEMIEKICGILSDLKDGCQQLSKDEDSDSCGLPRTKFLEDDECEDPEDLEEDLEEEEEDPDFLWNELIKKYVSPEGYVMKGPYTKTVIGIYDDGVIRGLYYREQLKCTKLGYHYISK